MSVHGGNPAQPPAGSRPAPDAIQVTCVCGAVYRGARQRSHQVQRCHACGDEIFILPASPYPARRPPPDRQAAEDRAWQSSAPRPKAHVVKGPSFRRRLNSALDLPDKVVEAEPIDVEPVDVEPIDDPQTAPMRVHAAPTTHAPSPQAPGPPAATPTRPARAPESKPLPPPTTGDRTPQPPPPDRPHRPLWKRPKLLICLVGLLLALTVALPLWNGARERSAARMRRHADEGWQAYIEGDFETAKAELGQAVGIMNRLNWPARWIGRTNRHVRDLRDLRRRDGQISLTQAYREAAICEDLLRVSLDEMARDAAGDLRRNPPQEAAAQFQRRYQGQAVLFDTTIDPAEGTPETLPPLLKVDERAFRFDVRDFELLQRMHGDKPQRVVFGARLDTLVPADETGREWLIHLRPDSGVLFTSPTTLDRLGWNAGRPFPVEPQWSAVIESQREEVQQWSAD